MPPGCAFANHASCARRHYHQRLPTKSQPLRRHHPSERYEVNTTADIGTGAAAADGPSGTNGSGLNEHAEWIAGVHWADALNVDPETPVADVCGIETWKAVRKFCRQHEVSMYLTDGANSMVFSDFDAVPREVWATASPRVSLTRAEVAEFAADTITDDPHIIGARLKRARWDRLNRKKLIDAALSERSLSRSTAYTLDEISEVAGPEVAEACRQLIDDTNRRAWGHPKPHSYREHEYVMTAGELVEVLGVPVGVVAAMTAVTDAQRNAALADLAIARIRHTDSLTARARAAGSDPVCNAVAHPGRTGPNARAGMAYRKSGDQGHRRTADRAAGIAENLRSP